jgi:hypothetical protein
MENKTAHIDISAPMQDLAPVAIADLEIVIPLITARLARAALKYAWWFSSNLHARIRLIDVHVVPYGVPLDRPTVDSRYLARRLRQIVEESRVSVSAEIVYARDWEQGLRRSLSPGSLVVFAVRRSWWRMREKRLAARLRKAGHQVVWVESE